MIEIYNLKNYINEFDPDIINCTVLTNEYNKTYILIGEHHHLMSEYDYFNDIKSALYDFIMKYHVKLFIEENLSDIGTSLYKKYMIKSGIINYENTLKSIIIDFSNNNNIKNKVLFDIRNDFIQLFCGGDVDNFFGLILQSINYIDHSKNLDFKSDTYTKYISLVEDVIYRPTIEYLLTHEKIYINGIIQKYYVNLLTKLNKDFLALINILSNVDEMIDIDEFDKILSNLIYDDVQQVSDLHLFKLILDDQNNDGINMIYAGDKHIQHVKGFLETIGYKE